MSSSLRILSLASIVVVGLPVVVACNGAVAAEATPRATAAPTGVDGATTCAATSDGAIILAREAPGGPLASDGTSVYFLRPGTAGGAASLVRVPVSGGALEVVSTVDAEHALVDLAGGPGRVAFARGVMVPGSEGPVVSAREVLVVEAGAMEAFVVYGAPPGSSIQSVTVSRAGDVLFTVATPNAATRPLLRWRAGALATLGELPVGSSTLADEREIFVAVPTHSEGGATTNPSIARLEGGVGSGLTTLVSFPESRKIWGVSLVGADATMLYFSPNAADEGSLRRVARAGGDDELVLPSTWPLVSVFVDDQPSIIAATANAIFRQPKDGSQRTVLAASESPLGNVLADTCNVYWTTYDPPRVMARRR